MGMERWGGLYSSRHLPSFIKVGAFTTTKIPCPTLYTLFLNGLDIPWIRLKIGPQVDLVATLFSVMVHCNTYIVHITLTVHVCRVYRIVLYS